MGKEQAGPIATVIFVEVSVETRKRCEKAMWNTPRLSFVVYSIQTQSLPIQFVQVRTAAEHRDFRHMRRDVYLYGSSW